MSDSTRFIYGSSLARDAALDAPLAQAPAAFVERHKTFGEFSAELNRALPLDTPNPKLAKAAFAAAISEGAGRLALLARAARAAAPGELGGIAASIRALQASGKLIFSWKGLQLRPDDLRAAAALLLDQPPASKSCAETLLRLARLYELYEKNLGADFADREALERNLLSRLKSCRKIPARILPPGAAVELVGFHRLAWFQQRIVEDLQRLGHRVQVRTPFFISAPGSPGSPGQITPTPAQPVESRIAAPSPYTEVDAIGRLARAWIARDKIAPSDIAVSFRDLGGYSQAVHDVFTRLHIPFFERRGEPAAFQPLVRVALSAIEACIAGLDRRSLFRFLCAGPVDVAALAGVSGPVDPHALNDLALEAGIEQFFGDEAAAPAAAWRSRLDAHLKALELQSGRAAEIQALKKSARLLNALVERLSALRAKRSARAFALAWKNIFKWTQQPAHAPDSKQRLALQALDAALDEAAAIPHAATEKIELEDFLALLNAAIRERSIHFDGVNRDGVQVLNFYDLRGLSFRRVALGGLSESLCPLQPASDPILGAGLDGDLRAALSKQLNDRGAAQFLSPRLSSETQAEERALYACARACARERLALSRPLRDFDGASLGASEFWDESSAPIDKYVSLSPVPPMRQCLTASERELRAAWILGGGGSTDAAETALALVDFDGPSRLQTLARAAAVEQQRTQSFAAQALQNLRAEKDSGAGVDLPPVPEFSDLETFNRVARLLAPRGIGAPLLSPSDIENLAQCPFKFFTEKICRFERHEEPGEELSALDAGSLWHTIFSRFYAHELDRARALGLPVAMLDPKRKHEYLKRLLFIAGEELVLTARQSFTGHPGFWKLHEHRVKNVLASWLDCELKNPADGFHPAFVEFQFGPESGPDGGGALAIPLGLDSTGGSPAVLQLKGRMDRLDLKLESCGGKSTLTAVRIIDYKSSAAARCKKQVKAASLDKLLDAQLPVYLAAAIAHLEKFCGERNIAIDRERVWKESRAGYYAIREAPLNSRMDAPPLIEIEEWPLGSARDFLAPANGVDPALFELVRRKALSALHGDFPVHPQACAGSHCPARQACRYVAMPAIGDDE